ncbi:MAG: hypothetical protein ACM3PZ_03420 [Bacillota bacterium]
MEPKTKIFTTILSLTILAAAGYAIFEARQNPAQTDKQSPVANEGAAQIRKADYETYLRENINALSPEKPVLGGTFYVTEVTWIGDRNARVSYEDGHIALEADIVFSVQDGVISVESFVVDPEDRIPEEERKIIEEPIAQ